MPRLAARSPLLGTIRHALRIARVRPAFYGPWACIYGCTRPQGGLVCGGDVVVTPPIIVDV